MEELGDPEIQISLYYDILPPYPKNKINSMIKNEMPVDTINKEITKIANDWHLCSPYNLTLSEMEQYKNDYKNINKMNDRSYDLFLETFYNVVNRITTDRVVMNISNDDLIIFEFELNDINEDYINVQRYLGLTKDVISNYYVSYATRKKIIIDNELKNVILILKKYKAMILKSGYDIDPTVIDNNIRQDYTSFDYDVCYIILTPRTSVPKEITLDSDIDAMNMNVEDALEHSSDSNNCILSAIFNELGHANKKAFLYGKLMASQIRKQYPELKNALIPHCLDIKYAGNGKDSSITSISQRYIRFYHKCQLEMKSHNLITKINPIFQFGNKKRQTLDIVFANGHAYQRTKKTKTDNLNIRINYPEKITFTGQFINYKINDEKQIIYAERLIQEENENEIKEIKEIEKIYNPNWLYGSIEKEQINDIFTTSPTMQAYTNLINKYHLVPTTDHVINELYKMATRYVGQHIYRNKTDEEIVFATDQKGSYSSFEYNEYYRGLPYGPARVSKILHDIQLPSFYILKDRTYKFPREFDIYNNKNMDVLPYPIYEYIKKQYNYSIPCQAYVYQEYKYIKYSEYLIDYENNIHKLPIEIQARMPTRKMLANSIIGLLISGTSENCYILKYEYKNKTERVRILNILEEACKTPIEVKTIVNMVEVMTTKYPIFVDDLVNQVYTLSVPINTISSFREIHATIVALSQVSVMTQMKKIGLHNILSVKTDCITFVVDGDEEIINPIGQEASENVRPGQFKYEKPNDKIYTKIPNLRVNTANESCMYLPESIFYFDKILTQLETMKKNNIISYDTINNPSRLAYLGPGGIGKTYSIAYIRDIVLNKEINMKLTSPTNNLAYTSKQGFSGTTHKQFNLLSTKKMSKLNAPKIIAIDEIFMFDQKTLSTILNCNNVNIIVMGDEKQVKCIKGKQITEEFLTKNNFTIIKFNRPNTRKECKVLRHRYYTGKWLDLCRQNVTTTGDSAKFIQRFIKTFQKSEVIKSPKNINNDRIISKDLDFTGDVTKINMSSRVIVGTNLEAWKINQRMKQYYIDNNILLFPCKLRRKYRDINGTILPKGFKLDIPVTSNDIWWDRKSMIDTPKESFLYEPAFCTTVYSSQGTEIQKDITLYIGPLPCDFMVYTAITRAKSFKQIKFINV